MAVIDQKVREPMFDSMEELIRNEGVLYWSEMVDRLDTLRAERSADWRQLCLMCGFDAAGTVVMPIRFSCLPNAGEEHLKLLKSLSEACRPYQQQVQEVIQVGVAIGKNDEILSLEAYKKVHAFRQACFTVVHLMLKAGVESSVGHACMAGFYTTASDLARLAGTAQNNGQRMKQPLPDLIGQVGKLVVDATVHFVTVLMGSIEAEFVTIRKAVANYGGQHFKDCLKTNSVERLVG